MSAATREQLRQIFRDQGWTEKDAEKIYSAISAIEKWHNSALKAQAQAHAEEVARLKLREAVLVLALNAAKNWFDVELDHYDCGLPWPSDQVDSALASTAPGAGELHERLREIIIKCLDNMIVNADRQWIGEHANRVMKAILSVAGRTA